MSFTYDNELNDLISQVRNLMGDIDEDTADFSNEEIQWYLDQHNQDIYLAGSEMAFRLAIQFSKMGNVASVDEVRVEYRFNAMNFRSLAERLKKMSAEYKLRKKSKAPMYFGGQDKSSFNKNREDMSLVPADFTKDGVFFDKDNPTHTPVRPTRRSEYE